MQEFVYLVRPCRKDLMESMTDLEANVIQDHFEYLKAALEAGQLILAGPCLDGTFGIVIFKEQSQQSAERFMLSDPAIIGGVFSYELRPFRVSLRSQSY